MAKKKWIQGAIKHEGALRKALHAKSGHKIGMAMLEKASHSKDPKLAARARLAMTFAKMRKKG